MNRFTYVQHVSQVRSIYCAQSPQVLTPVAGRLEDLWDNGISQMVGSKEPIKEIYPRVSLGDHPLTKEPMDSGYIRQLHLGNTVLLCVMLSIKMLSLKMYKILFIVV